jgi:biopolymer transport protein ExbB
LNLLASLIDYGVIGVLIFLSVLVVTVDIERFLYYRKIKVSDWTSRKELELYLLKNLHLVATAASNAPYIGLFGTVLGIMLTFYQIGLTSSVNAGEIMISLSLALKATAAGLVVAIVSQILYNLRIKKVKTLLLLWDIEHEKRN